jgi:hypothetical protein
MTDINEDDVERLRSEILAAWRYGELILDVRGITRGTCSANADIDANIIDHLIVANACRPISARWIPINSLDARSRLVGVLTRDLAYGGERMPLEDGARFTDRFVTLFGSESRYYTNGSFRFDLERGKWVPVDSSQRTVRVGGRWTPITDATFDTGVVVLSDKRIGMLWVMDDD